MPNLRLYDGDMKMIVKMLHDMRANLFEYGSAIAAICTEVKGLQQVVKDLSHADRQPRPRPAVSKRQHTSPQDNKSQNPRSSHLRHSNVNNPPQTSRTNAVLHL